MITFLATVTCFLATAIIIHFLRPWCMRVGLIDHPDATRKLHATSTPLCGGLGIVAGILLTMALFSGSVGQVGWPYLLAVTPLILVGVWDDLTEIHWWARMGAQILCALLMVYVGEVVILHLGDLIEPGRRLHLGSWAVPLTVFSIVGIINGINMLDGLDGLAGGVVMIALWWLAVAALIMGVAGNLSFVTILVAAIAGFLLFNLRYPVGGRALVFLGDTGSTVLGFTLGWQAIQLSQMQSDGLPPMSVIWIIGLPLFDAVTQIIRRLSDGRSPMSPDRNHLHHMLMRSGLTPGWAVAAMYLIAMVFGAIGIMFWRYEIPTNVSFWAFLTLFAIYAFSVIWGGKLVGREA